MKKSCVIGFCKAAIVGGMLLNAANAGESTGILGIGTSFLHFKTLDSLNLEQDYTVPSLDLKIGAKNDEWRFLLAYSFIKDESLSGGTAKNSLLTGQVDYLLYNIPMEGEQMIQPYIGATVGYEEYKFGSSIDESGAAYGGQLGAIWDCPDYSIDATFKYLDTSLDSVNEIYGFSLGFNYKLN
jgi:hypothetical protein